MPTVLPLDLVVLAAAVLINLTLAAAVFLRDRSSATNRLFAILSVIISLWLVAIYVADKPLNLWLTRMTLFFATPMNLVFLLLASTLPSAIITISRKKLWAGLIAMAFVMAVTLSPFAFTGLKEVNGKMEVVAGPGMALFGLFSLATNLSAVYVLFKKMRSSSGIQKKQYRLFTGGIVALFTLLIATILVPVMFFQNRFFTQFTPLYALIFLATTAVAIVKYRLFELKIVATGALTATLVFVVLFEGFTSKSLGQLLFKIAFAGLVVAIGALLVKSVKKEIAQREEMAVLNASLELSNEQLKAANLRLEQLDHQKTEFLSIASHQLRTPLSIINGYVELLADGGYGRMPKQSLPVFASITENTSHLVKLINEFLDITHIEQGKTKFIFQSFDLGDLVSQVVEQVGSQIKDKAVKIVWRAPSAPCMVEADRDKMRDVVFNLVDNAIKYTSRGTVAVRLLAESGNAVFTVSDQGLGFEDYDRVNFFQKFYRGKNVEGVNVTGTGLGLYVAGKFVEGHHGRVWCESPGINKGSTFGFEIPLRQGGAVRT